MRSHAQGAIISGDVVMYSILYHLIKFGYKDSVLVKHFLNAAHYFLSVAEIDLGPAPAMACRSTYIVALRYENYLPCE